MLDLLVGISASLKAVPKPRRRLELQASLMQINLKLQQQHPGQPCTWHATPLRSQAQIQSSAPLKVVNICVSEAHAFSTKERVPYLVYLELCSVSDSAAALSRPRAFSVQVSGPAAAMLETSRGSAESANQLGLLRRQSAEGSSTATSTEQPQQLAGASRAPPGRIFKRWSSERRLTSPTPKPASLPTASAPPVPAAAAPAVECRDEHVALDRLSRSNVILQSLPREISGADEPDESGVSAPQQPHDAGSGRGKSLESVFGVSFDERQAKVASTSPFAALGSWQLLAVVVKANDELRQEQFAMQLISTFDQIFTRAHLPLALRPYRIIATGPGCGIIEAISDALSLDSLKQKTPECPSLAVFFREYYGGNRRAAYHRARLNFARSAAAYSIVCYLLQIKDRHNGNIMLTRDGHVVHIDFGFLLSNSPGGNINFESAPFKLTNEYVDLLGGTHAPLFRYFRYLVVRGFVEARRHQEKILQIVQTTLDFGGAKWPCFRAGQAAIDALRARFQPDMSMQQYTNHVINLVDQAEGSFRTRCYDGYQYCCQGVA